MCRFGKGEKSMKNDKKISGFCCTKQGKTCNDEEIDKWKEEYKGQLTGEREGKKLGVYKDPDESHCCSSSDYYKLLEKFLTIRENDFKRRLNGNFKCKFCSKYPGGIKVYECKNGEDEYLFTLRSDLFGFSAPKLMWKTITNRQTSHPYDVYLKNKEEDVVDNVVDWILNSRNIGGVFLWPIRKCADGKYKTEYNIDRGGKVCIGEKVYDNHYYIQDRVDLTLLEIKHSYDDHYVDKYSGDKLFRYYIDENDFKEYESTHMKQWLNHFKDFKTYIEFFMLDGRDMNEQKQEKDYGINSFVDQNTLMPFDIVCANSNCLVDDIVKNNKRISQQSDIESMCKILVEKIMFRTERMLKCIEDRENKK